MMAMVDDVEVVAGETRESWEWFLMLLKEDLQIVRDDSFTFISDKQKGLVPALESVFPGSTNRFCVRHLHGNFKLAGFRGLAFKNALWKAARATTIPEFECRMKELKELDAKAHEWLNDKPAVQWSKSYFSVFPKCDILLNNICEVFNSCILEAREKPILTMLEWIREWLMKRMQENRDKKGIRWEGKLCPKIKKIVEKNIDKAADCIPIKADSFHYEISCFDGRRFVVDLEKYTCSCRKWDLSSIPCNHAMSAINCELLNPDDFVNECYWIRTYRAAYAPVLKPINGPELWAKTGFNEPLPPSFGRGVGRPTKARRMEHDEPKTKKKISKNKGKVTKLGRQHFRVTCQLCGEKGHNRKTCLLRRGATSGVGASEAGDTSGVGASEVGDAMQLSDLMQTLDREATLELGDAIQTGDKEAAVASDVDRSQYTKITARKRTHSSIQREDMTAKEKGNDKGKGKATSATANKRSSRTEFKSPRVVKQGREEVQVVPKQLLMPRDNISTFVDDPTPATQSTQTTVGSSNSIPVLVKDGKNFVTLPNLKKAVDGTKKRRVMKK